MRRLILVSGLVGSSAKHGVGDSALGGNWGIGDKSGTNWATVANRRADGSASVGI